MGISWGNITNPKKCQIPEDLRILALFQIFEILNWYANWINLFCAGTCTQVLMVPGWKKSIHFACKLRALGSWILQIQKSVRFMRISRFWHYIQNFIILLSALQEHVKSLHCSIEVLSVAGGRSCVGLTSPTLYGCCRVIDTVICTI
jgi:hypothetical protein